MKKWDCEGFFVGSALVAMTLMFITAVVGIIAAFYGTIIFFVVQVVKWAWNF